MWGEGRTAKQEECSRCALALPLPERGSLLGARSAACRAAVPRVRSWRARAAGRARRLLRFSRLRLSSMNAAPSQSSSADTPGLVAATSQPPAPPLSAESIMNPNATDMEVEVEDSLLDHDAPAEKTDADFFNDFDDDFDDEVRALHAGYAPRMLFARAFFHVHHTTHAFAPRFLHATS